MSKMQIKAKGVWYEVRASEDAAEVLIYGDIGESWWGESVTAKDFVEALASQKGKPLTVRINSYGGSVSDGLAIYNAIKRHDQPTTCEIDGVAVSIASLIALAGDTVRMADNALYMVHAPWGYSQGNASDMRDMADMLDKYAEAMSSAYMSKTGKSKDEIMSLLTDGEDHWFTAEEALAFGFVNELTSPVAVAASFNLGRFHRPNGQLQTNGVIPMTLKAKNAGDPSKPATTENPVPASPSENQPSESEIRAKFEAGEKSRRESIRARLAPIAASNADVRAIMEAALDDPQMTVEVASEKALAAMAKGATPAADPRHSPRIEAGKTAIEKTHEGITAALAARAGLEKQDGQNEFRGYSLLEMARASLEERGVSTRHMGRLELVEAALPSDARVRASTIGQTSSDFANLLANIAQKSMLKGYAEAGETFQSWTNPGVLTDFKPAKRVDLNEFPALAQINEGGEYSLGTLGDRGETVQLATYGKKFSISRQALINDDLSAFTRIPQKMGRAAIRTVGNLVYAVLTANAAMADGIALFHANHNNLLSAATPSTDSVSLAMASMMKQKDASGNVVALNIPLATLIVPVALEGVAWTVANSEYEVGTSNKNNTTPNFVRGRFNVISDARLDVASTSIWYGVANATMFDTIEVSYLDGNDQPYLEQQPSFDVDGLEFKVRIDAGVKALDFRTINRTG